MSHRHTMTATAALLLAVGSFGMPQPVFADGVEVRVYDREHHDYHNWNGGEDRVYRSYREGRHEKYIQFHRLDRENQRGYWNWRHEHPDND